MCVHAAAASLHVGARLWVYGANDEGAGSAEGRVRQVLGCGHDYPPREAAARYWRPRVPRRSPGCWAPSRRGSAPLPWTSPIF